jgi:glycosyltransferase involved in cell wall biosynthesis
MRELAIIGVQGIPGRYGGFETLAEQLTRYYERAERNEFERIVVYCGRDFDTDAAALELGSLGMNRVRLARTLWRANGWQSVFHDMEAIFRRLGKRDSVVLCLGVSGALAFPLLRFFRVPLIVNTDGIERQRTKWGPVARYLLALFEKIAVHFADDVIADNEGIRRYLNQTYRVKSQLIAYGGDHTVPPSTGTEKIANPSEGFDNRIRLSCLCICRIEPENHINDILDAVNNSAEWSMDFVGDWGRSAYGRHLKEHYGGNPLISLRDPIWSLEALWELRSTRWLYLHGHECGGTNPSLVEAMWAAIPTVCFDCDFNRNTTQGEGYFFRDSHELRKLLEHIQTEEDSRLKEIGQRLFSIAQDNYTWGRIGGQYFDLLAPYAK